MELAEGVYSFPVSVDRGDRVQTYHVSGVETEAGLVLVDVGLQGEVDRLASALDEEGFDLEDVETVLLTHHDSDHAGGLRTVVRRSGATVLAHPAETPYVDGRAHPIKSEGGRYPAVTVDVEVVEGVTLNTAAGPVHLVSTPGHSPGHLSLYLPESRLLLAGDALTAQEELSGPSERFTPDPVEATRSVGKLASLAVRGVLCYHGGFVEADADDVAAVHNSLRKES
jgi:glyoxylase-like metal-dependent hydrolase (beta-lactamase superfamily II)